MTGVKVTCGTFRNRFKKMAKGKLRYRRSISCVAYSNSDINASDLTKKATDDTAFAILKKKASPNK